MNIQWLANLPSYYLSESGDVKIGEVTKKNDNVLQREMFQNSNLNKPTIEGQMEKITGASNRIDEIMKEQADMYRPKTDAEIKAKFEKQNKDAAERLRKKMKDEPEDKADGGRMGFAGGKIVLGKKILDLLKNNKKIQEAVDNIFGTGDYKMDAEMAAESLVELNPKIFSNKLYDDLDSITRLDIYDAVISPMMSAQAKALRMKKATKPEKTLQSMKEGKGINMSDPEIAKEFEQFMKQTDPEGVKKLEQTLELDNFDLKGRKKNAQGGRAGFSKGSGLKTLFDFLNKKSPMKAYTDYLNSIKTRMKAGKEAEVAGEVIPIAAGGALITNQLKKKLKAMNEEQKKEFKKDMEKKADGGRIGLKEGNKKITIDAAGSKSGKQQIEGAPEGITRDEESINAIIKADIPITQKIDLLAKYQYGKGRTRIERDGQELFLDEGGAKSRDIGFGFNKDGEGIGGTLMYNMETGEPEFNIGFKKSFADGGRIGLKAGMTKRAFLKLMGGVGAGIAGLKSGLLGFGKGAGKQVAKEIITTPAAAGKPAWFDALVTRVVNEGEDVTKKFATKDREIVHATKVDDDAMVTVYRDLDDGTVRVDIDDATTNVMGEQGDSVVSLEVKGGQLEEGVKGKTPVEFEAREADYRNYMDGPDDYTTETIDNVVGDTKDLTADLTKVKMYAKGQKKPTIKEMMIQRDRAKTLKQAEENPAEYAADRGPDIDTKDYDYASGGIARMIGE